MILKFEIKKDISGFTFGLGIDFENCAIMIGLFYWCFMVSKIAETKNINNIEVIEFEKL